MELAPLGDRAVMITLGHAIDEATHRLVRAISARLDASPPAGVVDQVPAFLSIAVHYDPAAVPGDSHIAPYERMADALRHALADVRPDESVAARLVDIPVCYGGDLGPDLEDLARQHELSADDVIRIHTGAEYLVYMVGFMPGFAYMGGLPEQLVTPRRSSPRTAVPARSVGIGGEQTGVYPMESPGGWNLIGRTPAEIFDPRRDPATLLAAGDRVRFHSISLAEYRASRPNS
ncbi:MAG TPA: 5-oxoprolinase subunit PxpB [Gemmatimonadaceae bacterium]|jgi:inhibitor of KinA